MDKSNQHLIRIKTFAEYFLRYELVCLAILAPFLLFPTSWTPLLFLIVPTMWVMRRLGTGRWTKTTRMDIPIAIVVCMTGVGYLVSVDKTMSIAKFWGLLLQAAVFYGIVNGIRTRRQIAWLTKGLFLLTFSVAVLSLIGTDWGSVRLFNLSLYDYFPRLVSGLPGSGVPRSTDLFHPRQVGGTMAFLLPVTAVFALFGRGWRWRLSAGLISLSAGLIMLFSQAIGGYFGIGLAFLLIAGWYRRWLAAFLLVVGGAMAGGVLALFGPTALALRLLSPQDVLGIAVVLRIDMWNRALDMIYDMPLTGIGLNTFPHIQSHFYPGYLLGPHEVHAHNLFLQTAVDLGLPGLIAFWGIIIGFYITTISAYRRLPSEEWISKLLLVGIAGGVLAYLGNGIPDAITLGAKPIVVIWAYWGIAALIEHTTQQEGGHAVPKKIDFWWKGVTVGAVLLIFILLLFPTVRARNFSAVWGHQAIFAARMESSAGSQSLPPSVIQQLQTATLHTEKAIAIQPNHSHLWYLAANLYGWQGENEAAVSAWRQQISLESRQPFVRYAPFLVWQRALKDQAATGDEWEELQQVYRHWRTRYPQRAENYLKAAIVCREYQPGIVCDEQILQEGITIGARPKGILQPHHASP